MVAMEIQRDRRGQSRALCLFAPFLTMTVQQYCLADDLKPLGDDVQIGTGWWPGVTFNPDNDLFLVIWGKKDPSDNYFDIKGRYLDAGTGQPLGSQFDLGDHTRVGRAVHNPRDHYWFVVYGTDHDFSAQIYGQKVGTNGNIGSPILLADAERDLAEPSIAYHPAADRYLVVWQANRAIDNNVVHSIRGRFFDQDGLPVPGMPELQIGDLTERNQSGPVLAYNPASAQFLVVWTDLRNDIYRTDPNENNNNYTDVYGQVVNAADGSLAGSNVAVWAPTSTPYVGDGWDSAAFIACNTKSQDNSMYGTFLVVIDRIAGPAKGLILTSDGTHLTDRFDLSSARATSTGLAYNPVDNTYYASCKDVDKDISVQQISATGQVIRGPSKIIAHTQYEENFGDLAIRPTDGLCLQVTTLFQDLITLETPHSLVTRRFIRDMVAPGPVTNLVATPGLRRVTLTWANATDDDLTGTMIRYSTSGCPTDPEDGLLIVDQLAVPGSASSVVHGNRVPGTTYYYAAFTHDGSGNYAQNVCVATTISTPGDVDLDRDVDQSDFAYFQACLSGEAIFYQPGCADADMDADGDVDQADIDAFLLCLGGPNHPAGC